MSISTLSCILLYTTLHYTLFTMLQHSNRSHNARFSLHRTRPPGFCNTLTDSLSLSLSFSFSLSLCFSDYTAVYTAFRAHHAAMRTTPVVNVCSAALFTTITLAPTVVGIKSISDTEIISKNLFLKKLPFYGGIGHVWN